MRPRTLVAVTALALNWAAATASYADVGKIPASYGVNSIGGFAYSIPIWLPPGPHGVEPHLSLAYRSTADSNPADGMPQAGTSDSDEISAGVGWVLEGLSLIQRADKTVAQDGSASEPSYSSSDAYDLDGNRLRLTSSGNYGQDGSTYQTELANFSQATAHGSTGYGPQYWTVQGRNGLTYEYGNTADSAILVPGGPSGEIREWLLDKVSDVNGNTYTITYGTGASGSSGIGVPTSISWTPASAGSTTYNYEVALHYTTRQPGEVITAYAAGQQIENNSLLQNITVSYQGATVRYYQLSYTSSSATGRSLLASIQECSDSTLSDCIGPTTFSYNQGTPSIGSAGNIVVSGVTSVVGAYDFNGDGRSDILYNNGGTLYVALASASGGFNSPVSTGISAGSPYAVGDLLHQGEDGIIADNGGNWSYYTWTGSSFVGQAVTSGGSALPVEANATFTLADVDGDGLPDLIITHVIVGSSAEIYVRQNTSSGGQVSFSTSEGSLYTYNNPVGQTIAGAQVWGSSATTDGVHAFHFTGDSREGVLMTVSYQAGQTALFELVSNGLAAPLTLQELTASYSGGPVVALNWNSDRCTDLAWNETVFVAPCNGAADSTYSVPYPIIGAITLNGDVDADLLVDEGGSLGYYPSTGNGIGTLVSTSITGITISASALPISVTGDGLPDLGVVSGGTITYYQHAQVSSRPDLLSSLTDGAQNTTELSYASITAAAYTSGTGATDPESNWIGDLWVTQTMTLPDGIGGTYNDTYAYTGARWNRLRGFEGFSQIKATDSRNGLYSQTSYDQLFPLTGRWSETDAFQPDGTPISKTISDNTDEALDSTPYNQQYFPYSQTVTQDAYEAGGAENGQEITETVINYTPDQYGNFTEINSTATDKDPSSPFSGQQWTTDTTAQLADDKSTWCLSLATSASITKTAPSEPAITRTTTFTPDETNCRESSETEDAGNSSFDVTRSFQYDSFGNVDQIVVTGAGMAARTWTIGWGVTGQFPEAIQDPVGVADAYEEAIGYNFGLGLKSSDVVRTTGGVDNSPPTAWSYDAFGRVKQETLPDGTSQNLTYEACTSNCYNGNHFETITATLEGTAGAEITDKSVYLDRFGRLLIQRSRLMDGSYAQIERQYDVMGNVAKQSAPCAAASCTDYWTQPTYDVLNRPTSITKPDPENTSVLDTLEIGYAGRTTTLSGPLPGQGNTKTTDVTGALRETRDSYGYGQDFTRDSDGNVVSVSSSSGGSSILSYTYDYGGEGDYVATRTDQALGGWVYTPDALGEVTSYTDAKGQVFDLYYDALSRLTEREDGVPTSGSPETVTTWTWGHTPSAHDVNQLDQAQTVTADGTYMEAYSYDGDGRLYDKSITIPSDATYHYDYAYDPTTGLLSTLQYPLSGGSYRLTLAQCYQYGILTEVADTSCSGSPFWEANSQSAMGGFSEDTLGNGIVTQRTFLPVTGWLGKAISGPSPGSATVQNRSYLYDASGNVIQRQDNNSGLTESLWYDNDARLTTSTLLNGNTTTTNLQVSYNPDGSISQKMEAAGTNGETDAPVPYAVSQWTSYNYPQTITVAGTVNGNESAAFDYGPDRQRWRMAYTEGTASETTEYIGALMEKESSSSALLYRYYIYGGSGLAAIESVDSSGTPSTDYVLTDQENSLSSILTSGGGVAVSENFTAYGNRRDAGSWAGPPTPASEATMDSITRRGFTGQTVLAQMGLNHMNGRVEDAISGTFLSPDPSIPDPTNTQDYNRYVYANDNPVTLSDPTGFCDDNKKCDDKSGYQNGNSGGSGGSSGSGGLGTVVVTGLTGIPDLPAFMSLDNGAGPSAPQTSPVAAAVAEAEALISKLPQSKPPQPPSLCGEQCTQQQGQGDSSPQNNPDNQLQPVTVTATKVGAQIIDQPIDSNSLLFLAGATANAWNGLLASMGCKGACQTLLAVATVLAAPEAAETEAGEYSLYDSTGGLKGLNTDVTADEFSANLQANGYSATERMGSNGPVTVLQNGQGSTWTIYSRSSTGDMGAQFIGPDGQFLKYNLGVQGLPGP